MLTENIKEEVIQARQYQVKRLRLKDAVYESQENHQSWVASKVQDKISMTIKNFAEAYCKKKLIDQSKVLNYEDHLRHLLAKEGYPFAGNDSILQNYNDSFFKEEIEVQELNKLRSKIDAMFNPWILSAYLYRHFIQIINEQINALGFKIDEKNDEICFSIYISARQKWELIKAKIIQILCNITGCSNEQIASCFLTTVGECTEIKIKCSNFKKILIDLVSDFFVEIDLQQYEQYFQSCSIENKLEFISSVLIFFPPEDSWKKFSELTGDFFKESVKNFSPAFLNLYEVLVIILTTLSQKQRLDFMNMLLRVRTYTLVEPSCYLDLLWKSIAGSIDEGEDLNDVKNLVIDSMEYFTVCGKQDIFAKLGIESQKKIVNIYMAKLTSGCGIKDLLNAFDFEKNPGQKRNYPKFAFLQSAFLQDQARQAYQESLARHAAPKIQAMLENQRELDEEVLALARLLPCNIESQDPKQAPYTQYLGNAKILPRKEIFARLALFYLQIPNSIEPDEYDRFIKNTLKNNPHKLLAGFFTRKRLERAIKESESAREKNHSSLPAVSGMRR